jgi:tetraacyldisaccharide 4'-kinase
MTTLHYRPSLSPWLWPLLPMEWGYKMLVESRLRAYQSGFFKTKWVEVPVISVGNLTTGGTGKTPCVLEICRWLIGHRKKVVVLSRGYGAEAPASYARATDPKFGDEAYFLQQQLPEAIVIVGKDRVKNAQRAIRDYHPDIIVLDDGYQHLRLGRTVNILLVDGHQAFGNNHLLPAGPLREPLDQIRRAHAIWMTRSDNQADLKHLREYIGYAGKFIPIHPVPFEIIGYQSLAAPDIIPVTALKGKSAVVFSGIAKPERFEADLAHLGIKFHKTYRFTDHHRYAPKDMAQVMATLSSSKEPLWITTEKDRTKIERLIPDSQKPSVYTLIVRPVLQWDGALAPVVQALGELSDIDAVAAGNKRTEAYWDEDP